ncbi:hypothetical protein ACFL0D_06660 [Thermoproteota archaeon]
MSAFKLAFRYLRRRLKDLVILFVLSTISGFVLMIIPLFGWIAGYGLTVVFNLALIDNYLYYQTIEIAVNLATRSEENL